LPAIGQYSLAAFEPSGFVAGFQGNQSILSRHNQPANRAHPGPSQETSRRVSNPPNLGWRHNQAVAAPGWRLTALGAAVVMVMVVAGAAAGQPFGRTWGRVWFWR